MRQARAEGTRQHRHRGTKELRKTDGSQHPLGKLLTAPRNKPNSPQSVPESPVTLSGRREGQQSCERCVSHFPAKTPASFPERRSARAEMQRNFEEFKVERDCGQSI